MASQPPRQDPEGNAPPRRRRGLLMLLSSAHERRGDAALTARQLAAVRRVEAASGGSSPQSADFLIFSLGFASVVSLVFMTGDLLSTQTVSPATITVFVLATSYCWVLVRRQRLVSARQGGDGIQEIVVAGSPGAQNVSGVLDKETRHRLLNYFVLTAPEEEKGNNGDEICVIPGGQEEAAGEGRAPPPPYLSPPPANASPSPKRLPTVPWASPGLSGHDPEQGAQGAVGATATGETDSSPMAAEPDGDGGSEVGRVLSPKRNAESTSGESPAGGGESDAQAKSTSVGSAGNVSAEWCTEGSCIVCFGDYNVGEELCRLPCRHLYHARCIDAWLDGPNHAWCPLCKSDVVASTTRHDQTPSEAQGLTGMHAV